MKDQELRDKIARLPVIDPHDNTVLGVIGEDNLDRIMALIAAKTTEVDIKARMDELGQLAMYETKTIGIIHGRHQRSYSDRIIELQALSEKENNNE